MSFFVLCLNSRIKFNALLTIFYSRERADTLILCINVRVVANMMSPFTPLLLLTVAHTSPHFFLDIDLGRVSMLLWSLVKSVGKCDELMFAFLLYFTFLKKMFRSDSRSFYFTYWVCLFILIDS